MNDQTTNGTPGSSGAVNFDSNLVTEDAQLEMHAVNASPVTPVVTIGGIRELGEIPAPVVPAPVVEERVMGHTMSMSLNLTINDGFELVKGQRGLKSVEIDLGSEGGSTEWNFYNPFVRSDADKNTGEGLLRKCLATLAKNAFSVLGQNVVFLGGPENAEAVISGFVETVRSNIEQQLFPLLPTENLLAVPIVVDGVEVPRTITFGDLFSVKAWHVTQTDDDACVTNYMVNVNIIVNAAAFYDSKEPHNFVNNAYKYLERTLQRLGIADKIGYHVIVGIDSNNFTEERTRNLIDVLVADQGYYVMSKASVESGVQNWVHSGDVDKLFGYGCDVALISPEPSDEADAEAE